MEYPLVSIIIPTFNQADVIHRAIESALSQKYPKLEIILSDDNSTDETERICKKYQNDSRFKYYKNAKNLGRVGNYKISLEKYATGDWVVNCDGDDYYIDLYFIKEVMDLIIQSEEKHIVFAQGGKIVCYKGGEKYDLPNINTKYKIIDGKDYFLGRIEESFFTHMATIYKRKLALFLDFYSSDIISADRESFFKLALHGKVLLIKKAYGKWIGHGENLSLKSDLYTISKNYNYITSVSDYAEKLGYPQEVVEYWKQIMTLKYYSDWINKIGCSQQSIVTKANNTYSLIKYVWTYHRKLFNNANFILTIIKIPARWIFNLS